MVPEAGRLISSTDHLLVIIVVTTAPVPSALTAAPEGGTSGIVSPGGCEGVSLPPTQQQMSPVAVLASVPPRADGPLTPEGGCRVRLRPEDDLFKCTFLISGVCIRLFLVFSHSSEHSPAPPDSKPVSFRSSCLRAVSTAHELLGSICGYENRTF